jgi:hypothetical protein
MQTIGLEIIRLMKVYITKQQLSTGLLEKMVIGMRHQQQVFQV